MSVRQVLVFRRDLKSVRRGKMLAQAGHCSMMFIAEQLRAQEASGNTSIFVGDRIQRTIFLTQEQQEWFSGLFTKISLVVDGEKELEELHAKALAMGLTVHKVVDAGLTEFHGVPTLTCIAIGPHDKDRIDPLTGGLDMF